jgi:hypothetical protein
MEGLVGKCWARYSFSSVVSSSWPLAQIFIKHSIEQDPAVRIAQSPWKAGLLLPPKIISGCCGKVLPSIPNITEQLSLRILFFFFFCGMGFELRAYTVSYSTSPFFVMGVFEIGSL